MDIIEQQKQAPATNMKDLVSRWSTIMVPAQSARKRVRDEDEDEGPRPKTRAFEPLRSGTGLMKSEIQGAPAPCKTSY